MPNDNKLFHKCYNITIEFIENWPSKQSIGFLKTILNKFNTIVYFKMATQQFLTENKKLSKKFELNDIFEKNENSKSYNSIITNSSLNFINSVFSDNVYIDVLMDKFWDFTLKILENFGEWSKNINLYDFLLLKINL